MAGINVAYASTTGRALFVKLTKIESGGLTEIWDDANTTWAITPTPGDEKITFAENDTGSYFVDTGNLDGYTGDILVQIHDDDDADDIVIESYVAHLNAGNEVVANQTSPSEQQAVSKGRTATLVRDADGGLVGETNLDAIQVGENVIIAVDFAKDLPVGGRVVSITSVAIQSGTASGVTLTAIGVDHTLAKVRVVGVTADTYTVRVKVTYAETQAAEGDVTFKVVSA